MTKEEAKARLEYLRRELQAERISYGELAEMQSLRKFIEPGDVELLEAAGVPEFPQETKRELEITITDEDSTFTEQLERIITQINEGFTSGQGWSIGGTEEDEEQEEPIVY